MDFKFFQPTRIIFGPGKLNSLGETVKSCGNSCLLVTTTSSEEVMKPLYERTLSILNNAGVRCVHFDEVVPNPDISGISKAVELVRKEHLDVIVGLGGGSSLDTAKAIALFWESTDLDWKKIFSEYSSPFEEYGLPGTSVKPVIAVPTTAGTGSEMTQAMIISDHNNNDKECVYHRAVFPKYAIIDPELCRTLPKYQTAVTGFDAFTHAFESYMREHASPYTMSLGTYAMKTIIDVLPKLMDDLSNMDYRQKMSMAACFAGISLANASATIPHPLSEVIGGVAPRIPHGQCLASLYHGYLMFEIYNRTEKCAQIARLFDSNLESAADNEAAEKLPGLMDSFLSSIGLNKSLRELGVSKDELAEMQGNFVFNVLPFAPKETLLNILTEAYGG